MAALHTMHWPTQLPNVYNIHTLSFCHFRHYINNMFSNDIDNPPSVYVSVHTYSKMDEDGYSRTSRDATPPLQHFTTKKPSDSKIYHRVEDEEQRSR